MVNCRDRESDVNTMRRLMLLRHAKAEKAKPGEPDRDRTLNAKGREDAPKIGFYMARHKLVPQRAVISPTLRTRETWDLLSEESSAAPLVLYDEHLYNASAETILKIIQTTPPDVHSLLVVGHNPGLHEAARLLIASGDVELRERLQEDLPTAGLAVIDFALDDWSKLHPHAGRLDRFVSPRSLELAGD
jgi:phosphohistidine phosphatase